MNFLVISSVYRYLRFFAPVSAKAKTIISRASGVEPTLFFAPRMIDWQKKTFYPEVVAKILEDYRDKKLPLTNGEHGIRVHGFIDLGRPGNRVFYADHVPSSIAVLTEQIKLTAQLAQIAGLDTAVHPSIITIHLGRSRGDMTAELDRLVRIFNEITPIAKAHNTIINIENVWNPGGVVEYSLGSDLADLVYLFDHIADPSAFGVTFDFAHGLIHYQGDYDKLRSDLVTSGLLPHITYLHLTMPGRRYHKKFEWVMDPRRLPGLGPVIYFFYRNPDSQGGISRLQRDYPHEVDQLADLMKFVAGESILKKPSTYHCATLEVGMKIPFTHSGAKIPDITKTFDWAEGLFS